jgi:ATP-binding cassette subfamily B protein
MGFIMDGLDAEGYDRQYSDGDLFRRILQYFRPQVGRMALVSVAVLSTAALDTLLPIYVSRTLDVLDATPETFNIRVITLTLMVLASLSWVFNGVRQWMASRAIGEVVLKLREDAFDAITQRDMSFFDEYPTGKIVSRVTSDTAALSETVNLTANLVSQLLLVVFLIGYLFSVNVTLTFVTLGIAPFIIAVALAFRVIARRTVTASRRVMATVSALVQETIGGIAVAKTFRKEAQIYREFTDVNNQAYEVNLRSGFTFGSIFPILITIAAIGTGVLVYVGAQIATAENSTLTAGEWYLFIMGVQMFWFPLTSIASFWSQFQLGLAAGERVFALLDAEPKVVQSGKQLQPEHIMGEIAFEGVSFAYKDDEPVLTDFSLNIPAGQTLALVGHTGSGKSSIAKLVARYYEFQAGTLRVDGHDIRDLDLKTYREALGIVTQTPFLFDGTVMDNIRYGRMDYVEDVGQRDSHTDAGYTVGGRHATDEEVIAVANAVAGGDWLKSLPDGLQTQVGDRGSNLSIGQRQLVAIARVMLENPRILILDEATASIDPLTEALIQEGLEVVLEGRTAIVIAHRLSTIQSADRIIVLNKGAILEEGTHDGLMAAGGHYAELYNTYFRHQSLDYIERADELLGAD